MKHGRIVQIAQPLEISISFRELIFRDIRIVGSLTGSRKQTGEMLDFASKHGIHVETNVYYGLDKVPQMIEESHHGRMKGKSVVVVDESLQSSLSKAAL
jgi:propanol-preferring alcohol dehydrogenase